MSNLSDEPPKDIQSDDIETDDMESVDLDALQEMADSLDEAEVAERPAIMCNID